MASIRAIREAGRKHYNNGIARENNPYSSDPGRKAWFMGWDERHIKLSSAGYSKLYVAKQLDRKHRSYGNPSNDINPYHQADPRWQAWRDGWNARDKELTQ